VLDAATRPFLFRITEERRAFLLQEGTDQRYGARQLKRALERYMVYPIARLLATAQVHDGDVLVIDRNPADKALAFLREPERPALDLGIFAGGYSGQLTQQVLEGT
jgi:ATP-dependent Clp protease ATP-binding subunit ClpA